MTPHAKLNAAWERYLALPGDTKDAIIPFFTGRLQCIAKRSKAVWVAHVVDLFAESIDDAVEERARLIASVPSVPFVPPVQQPTPHRHE